MSKCVTLILMAALGVGFAQDEKQIWDTFFEAGREKADIVSKTSPAAPHPRPQYRRASPVPKPNSSAVPGKQPATGNRALGVTVWKMEPPRPDDNVRLLVLEGERKEEYTPHRLGPADVLAVGDRVRVSVETSAAGYLYVVDQELMGNGQLGAPYLIFPVTRVRGGNNHLVPGQLTEIPARTDKVSVFSIRPAVSTGYLGEKLTFFLRPQPFPALTVKEDWQLLADEELRLWESQSFGSRDVFELAGQQREPWTKGESDAGQDLRLLTLDDPPPQTVFVAPAESSGAFLATVILKVAAAGPK